MKAVVQEIKHGKLYKVWVPKTELEILEVQETRQPVEYRSLYERYSRNEDDFANWIKKPCAPKGTKRHLVRLFNHPIHNVLLTLENFHGVWKKCTWSAMAIFSDLLEYTPQELMRVLQRVVIFWENVASISRSRDSIVGDEHTACRISGLWPSICEADDSFFQTAMQKRVIFRSVENSEARKDIRYLIENLDHRVPTFGTVVPECRALLRLARQLRSALPPEYELCNSAINSGGWRATRRQYYECFLASARSRNEEADQLKREVRRLLKPEATYYPQRTSSVDGIIQLLKLTTNVRVISEPPNGLWAQYDVPLSRLFEFNVLQESLSHAKFESLPVLHLFRDFFEGFFGRREGPEQWTSGTLEVISKGICTSRSSYNSACSIGKRPSYDTGQSRSGDVSPLLVPYMNKNNSYILGLVNREVRWVPSQSRASCKAEIEDCNLPRSTPRSSNYELDNRPEKDDCKPFMAKANVEDPVDIVRQDRLHASSTSDAHMDSHPLLEGTKSTVSSSSTLVEEFPRAVTAAPHHCSFITSRSKLRVLVLLEKNQMLLAPCDAVYSACYVNIKYGDRMMCTER